MVQYTLNTGKICNNHKQAKKHSKSITLAQNGSTLSKHEIVCNRKKLTDGCGIQLGIRLWHVAAYGHRIVLSLGIFHVVFDCFQQPPVGRVSSIQARRELSVPRICCFHELSDYSVTVLSAGLPCFCVFVVVRLLFFTCGATQPRSALNT